MSMPSEEQTYRDGQDARMKRFEIDMRDSQTRQELKLEEVNKAIAKVDEKVTYTNGKVRKIIIAFVFLVGLVVGLGAIEAKMIVPILGL